MTTSLSPPRPGPPRTAGGQAARRAATVMLLVAASLVIASAVHLFGHVTGRNAIYDASDAGVAEAIIAVVLVGGAFVLRQRGDRGRAVGVAATGFAIAGYGVGLSITARSGHWPDIFFHLIGLPILLWCLALLVRRPAETPSHS